MHCTGNANEDTWYASPSVMTINVSQSGIWPGPMHGRAEDVGSGEGRGFNLNFPVPEGEGDGAYVYLFEKYVFPALIKYRPELVVVASGFDAIEGDPYAGMRVTPAWFGWATARLVEITRCIACPMVLNLEGGYNPPNVAQGFSYCVSALEGTPPSHFLGMCKRERGGEGLELADGVKIWMENTYRAHAVSF